MLVVLNGAEMACISLKRNIPASHRKQELSFMILDVTQMWTHTTKNAVVIQGVKTHACMQLYKDLSRWLDIQPV